MGIFNNNNNGIGSIGALGSYGGTNNGPVRASLSPLKKRLLRELLPEDIQIGSIGAIGSYGGPNNGKVVGSAGAAQPLRSGLQELMQSMFGKI